MAEIPRPDGPNIDIGGTMLATCWSLYAIAGIIVGLRVLTQVKITRQFGLGDIVMIAALSSGYIEMVLLTISRHYGLGRHFFYLSDLNKVRALKFEFISEPFAIMSSTLGRVSFIILMFRLFGTTKLRRWFLHFMIVQTLVVNLFTCITIFTQCKRPETIWDPVGTPSACWDHNVQAYIGFVQGGFNSLTDLAFTVLPSSIFWTLQMKLRIKLGLAALLGLSIFAFAASIVKTVKLKSLGERADYTFNTVNFMIWVVIENTFVIIAASIPLLRPMFSKAKKTVTGYGNNSSYEMNSRSNATKGHSQNQIKSFPLASSSEENILPLQSNTRSRTNPTSFTGNGKAVRESKDLEKGIKKETTVQIRYDDDNGRGNVPNSKWGIAE